MNSLGMNAEIKACEYLQKKHYKLIASNYRTRLGEIDLIMRKGHFICFIEVKMRNEKSIALPREFVDKSKQDKIISSAMIYMEHTSFDLQPRFDVVEVYMKNNVIKKITHIENAFEAN